MKPSERPGEFPYTRGITERPGPWIMGQYSGFGTPAQTNERFRALLAAGLTGFSVALDLPTQMGIDADDPLAAGEVGRVGVALSSYEDVRVLMDGIPLEEISQVRTTANAIGPVWAGWFAALARERGVAPDAFGLFIQNDVLKEFVARGTQILPPAPSLALSVDVMEWCAGNATRWTPLAMSGYHFREAGATAAQELAFTFADGFAYLDALVARGVPVDAVGPSLFTFLSSGPDVVEEVAKFRAARRVWATMVRERYRPTDPRTEQLRIFVFTAGSSLTAQQPLNNLVRTAVEATVAAIGGVQTMHVCAYDEALGVPTAEAAQLALRTQQVVAFETGLTAVVDPLGGAYEIEAATDRIEGEVRALLADIAGRGGAVACIESGWFAEELERNAFAQQRAIEAGEKVVVGVNAFVEDEPAAFVPFAIDPGVEVAQAEAVAAVRARRDRARGAPAHDARQADARAGRNVVPACIEA
ncbi:MAG: methylmalonyl-CoA mutase family protein, partial [Actinomycetota bacterium]